MKKILILTAFIGIVLTGCRKTDFSEPSFRHLDPAAKTSVEQWLAVQQSSTGLADKIAIGNLAKRLDWQKATVTSFGPTQQLIYIPVTVGRKAMGLSVIIDRLTNVIASAELIQVIDLGSDITEENLLLLQHYSKSVTDFTGTILLHELNGKVKKVYGYVQGKKHFEKTQVIKPKNAPTPGIKLNAEPQCYTVWWVTFSWDGSSNWEYMGAYCDGPCQTTSIIDAASGVIPTKLNCGGAAGGPAETPLPYDDATLEAFQSGYRAGMSPAELDIFDNELTPKQRTWYLANALTAQISAALSYLTSQTNGKGDAYRHALFVALNAESLGPLLAARLAGAHENWPPGIGNDLEKLMDSRNNQKGLEIFFWLQANNMTGNSYYSSLAQIKIHEYMNNGSLWIISPLGQFGEVLPNSQVVQSNQ